MEKYSLSARLKMFANKKFGTPIDFKCIPGYFNGEILYKKTADMFPDNSRFVEVGCLFGRSTCFMAQRLKKKHKKIRFDVIDTFEGSPEHYPLLQGKSFYETFCRYMRAAGVLDMLTVKQARSEKAAYDYADGSLDFVYIDAAHDFESVKRDIDAWLPKVKNGGILAGDDYIPSWQGVIDAVNEKLGRDTIELIPYAQWSYRKSASFR
jgi:predicted O-methyltransferase YrrM